MWCSLSVVDSGTVSSAGAAVSAAGASSGCAGVTAASAAGAGTVSPAGAPSCSSGSSGRLIVSSFSGLQAAGFSSSAVPNIWKIDFFSGFFGSVSGSAGTLANTADGSSSAGFCAAFAGVFSGSAAGCAGAGCTLGCGAACTGFAGCGAGFALPLMPLSISFSCCISRCSSSSCGSSVSGAFFVLGCFWGAATGCGSGWGAGFFGCGFTEAAALGAGTGSAGTALTGSGRAGCIGITGTGSAVRSSSAMSSCSGCTGFASAPSRISPVGISSTGCAGAGVSSLSWPNSLPSSPALGFSSTGAGASRWVISSGRSITLVLKKLRKRSSAESSPACLPLCSFLLFGILVPPTVLDGVYRLFYSSTARCDWISYRMMPAATETL